VSKVETADGGKVSDSESAALRDEELVAKIKAGDPLALDELVKAYFGWTYKKVRRLVPIDDVDDVTQDIMLNLIKSINNFQGKSAFATWFHKMVANRVADYHRRMFRTKARFVSSEDLEGWEPSQDPDDRYGDDYEARELLMVLPESYREIIMMKLYFDLSFAEIVEATGLTYGAARSRYRRGIKYARGKIDPSLLRKHR